MSDGYEEIDPELNVLFLTTSDGDYLQDQLLIGLRRLLGERLVDYPRKDIIYTDCESDSMEIYGRGFTIWKSLPPVDVDRSEVWRRLRDSEFDALVFGSIHRQRDPFWMLERRGLLDEVPVVFLDGKDFVARRNSLMDGLSDLFDTVERRWGPFKNSEKYFMSPVFKPALPYGPYFKRELTQRIRDNHSSAHIFPISFSIPAEKIRNSPAVREHRFPSQVQCEAAYAQPEIREHSVTEHLFEQESAYYDDLAASYFGITQQKAGWDAMRHYEIAANLAVPCFYRLNDKPPLCAPHGLRDMANCLSFADAAELAAKTEYVLENEYYEQLVDNVSEWIRRQTCRRRAAELLSQSGLRPG